MQMQSIEVHVHLVVKYHVISNVFVFSFVLFVSLFLVDLSRPLIQIVYYYQLEQFLEFFCWYSV